MKEADRSFVIPAYFQCQVQPRFACSDYSLLYGVLGQKKDSWWILGKGLLDWEDLSKEEKCNYLEWARQSVKIQFSNFYLPIKDLDK